MLSLSLYLPRVHMRVHVCIHARVSVICSHTCVSQRLHPAAPLSCCHGELPLAYSKCIGVCVCASSCVQLHVLLLANVCVYLCTCMLYMHACMETSVPSDMFLSPFVCMHMHLVHMRVCVCLCTARVSACVLLVAHVPCNQTLRQMWEQGCDDSQRWWKDEDAVLFPSGCLSSRFLSP